MLNKTYIKNIQDALASIRFTVTNGEKVTSSQEKDLQIALNKFFSDSECKSVLYTDNISKPFFGMCVRVYIGSSTVEKILTDDNQVRLSKYSVEIDSKLITEKMLNSSELTACLLHEVGHVIDDSTPTNVIRKAIDCNLLDSKDQIKYVDSSAYWDFLAYGLVDSFRRINSIFCRNDAEIVADEFVVLCGYGEQLESAFRKISTGGEIGPASKKDNLKGKLCVLDWTLKMYSQMGVFRVNALRTLNKMKSLTGSKLELEMINDAIDALQKVNPTLQVRECTETWNGIVIYEDGYVVENSNQQGLVYRIQKKGLKGVEEDLFEYQMRIRNVEDEDEAINILRQINTRMSMLDDWIEHNPDDVAVERYQKVYNKYDILRDELAAKTTYTRKNYGLWFDYNTLENPKINNR